MNQTMERYKIRDYLEKQWSEEFDFQERKKAFYLSKIMQ